MFSLAYLIAWILPSIPLSPKPPGTRTPETSDKSSATFSAVTVSESIHLISTSAELYTPPCFKASTTLIYASWSWMYLPTNATLTFLVGFFHAWHIALHSSRSGSGQSSSRHSQATWARCSSSIARGAS